MYYVNSDFYKEKFRRWQARDPEYLDLINLNRHKTAYRPPTCRAVCREREYRQRKDRRYRFWRELLVCLLALLIILLIIDFKFISKAYYATKYYQYTLLTAKHPNDISFHQIRNQKTLYQFLNATFLPSLYKMSPTVAKKQNVSQRANQITKRFVPDYRMNRKLKLPHNVKKPPVLNTAEKNKVGGRQQKEKSPDRKRPHHTEIQHEKIPEKVPQVEMVTNHIPKKPEEVLEEAMNQLLQKLPSTTTETNNISAREQHHTVVEEPTSMHDPFESTKLISVLRMRQQRVTRNSCYVADCYFSEFEISCNGNLNPMTEDTKSYDDNWQTGATNESKIPETNELRLPVVKNSWIKQTEETTNTAPRYGEKTIFRSL